MSKKVTDAKPVEAETVEAVSVEMSPEEASMYEREIILGDPEKVKLPNGQTVAENLRERRARELVEGREASAAERESTRRQAASQPETVRVAVIDGQLISSTVVKEEAKDEKKDARTLERSLEPAPTVESVAEPTPDPVRINKSKPPA